MTLAWKNEAWNNYLWWQEQDCEKLKKINLLIGDCQRDPTKGLGMPEPLKGDYVGLWSRRIDAEHRLE